MKQIAKITTICSLVASLGLAYSVDGNLDFKFTGYKTQNKVGVKGSFKTIKLNSAENKVFVDFAKSLSVEIDGKSVDTKMAFRDKNVAILFATDPKISAKIKDVKGDEKGGVFVVAITLGKTTKDVEFAYKGYDKNIEAKGSIDILDFGMNEPFKAFSEKCFKFHGKKTWSNVDLAFNLPIKK